MKSSGYISHSARNMREVAAKFKDQLLKIKVLAFDIDGVLTDGTIRYEGRERGWNRSFNVNDGYGLKMMKELGLKIAIISGGDSLGVSERFTNLIPVDYLFLGNEDKRAAYEKILNDGYKDDEILYIGDEFFDLPLLKRVGFSAAPPSASLEIQEAVDYITVKKSGFGCAREVMDLVRFVHGFVPTLPDF